MNAKQLLQKIYQERYGKLELGLPETWNNLEELGEELANIIGNDRPWGKRYLYSILKYENYNISKRMINALHTFAAIYFDGVDSRIARLKQVLVYCENGNVGAGSIVLAHSKQCPNCLVRFVPVVYNQKYCTKDCKREYRKIRNGK